MNGLFVAGSGYFPMRSALNRMLYHGVEKKWSRLDGDRPVSNKDDKTARTDRAAHMARHRAERYVNALHSMQERLYSSNFYSPPIFKHDWQLPHAHAHACRDCVAIGNRCRYSREADFGAADADVTWASRFTTPVAASVDRRRMMCERGHLHRHIGKQRQTREDGV
jgi:hypothetical protein